ncbi:uncharacterized protein ACNLHF_008801 [Anomaloglossus baeobatrachus]
MGGLCDVTCKFIEHYLHPLVETLPSHVRDTSDVLRRLEGLTLEEGVSLVTMDVEALYSSIDHRDGLVAAQFFLDSSNLDRSLSGLIMELLEFVLTHNFFNFRDRFFLQRRGTAMGAACAPSYANLFLGYWEREVFGGGVPASSHAQCWLRYTDDILVVWGGTGLELEDFVRRLNSNDRNIFLTHQIGQRSIDFLDIRISIELGGAVSTTIFRKSTAVNSLLHATSGHPRSTVDAIPTGQFLRLRRLCSSGNAFETESSDMRERFISRGYSNRSIKRGYQRAKSSNRDQLLSGRASTVKPTGYVARFISTYCRQWEQIRGVLNKHWAILQTEPSLEGYLPDRPMMTARRGRSLKDMLVHSHYVAKTPPLFGCGPQRVGCYPCGSCRGCKNIIRATTFCSADGLREYSIRVYISCNTSGVIYYATCGCDKIYIGLTSRELRIRTREHVRDILAAKEAINPETLKTIPRHFREIHNCDPTSLKVRGIDQVHLGIRGGDVKKRLAQVECRWIFTLGTMSPRGLNERLTFVPFL